MKRLLRRVSVVRRVGPWANNSTLSAISRLGLFRHTNEVRYGANAQLLHHPAAMNLDGLLDGAQIAGNLLVEAACDHMHQHFALARGQGLDFRLDRFQF